MKARREWQMHPDDAIASMRPAWFCKLDKPRKLPNDGRTARERDFDSGVFAAAEFVRRVTGDETLALAVLEVCFWQQRERGHEPTEQDQ